MGEKYLQAAHNANKKNCKVMEMKITLGRLAAMVGNDCKKGY
jgi:hypothetical protein